MMNLNINFMYLFFAAIINLFLYENFFLKEKRKVVEQTIVAAERQNPTYKEHFLNKELPEFTLTTLDGKKISSKELKGKYIHINFWSVTCKPCIAEFEQLNKLKKKYESQNIIFLGFAPESADKVNRVLAKHPLNYTIVPDAKSYYQQLGIYSYPVNFFVDQSGKIVEVTEGAITYETTVVLEPNQSQTVVSISEGDEELGGFKAMDNIIKKMINQNK